MNFLEIYWTDVYKVGHKPMLPEGSTLMMSNMTPRSGKHANVPDCTGVVSAGMQKTVRQLHEDWQDNFFLLPIEEIDQFAIDMARMVDPTNPNPDPINVTHFKALHKLGYLPIRFKAIEEGRFIPYKVPMYTIVNTQPLGEDVFDWIVNYLETILSAEGWCAPTSATLGLAFRKLGNYYHTKTDSDNLWLLDYTFHDFSMRGMNGKSAIINSALGFAMTSRGSDTLPVIPAARKYYDEPTDKVCINSVYASEHAIMCSLTGFFKLQNDGSWDKIGELEVETFRYLLQKFPTGILSLVSDTWDLWRVLTDYTVQLKDEILARDGKLVFRPDSGDPVDIMCGFGSSTLFDSYEHYLTQHPEEHCSKSEWKGVVEILWDIFGGDTSKEGYRRLNPKVGAIYGDSINLDRAERIFSRLEAKGFASTNVVLGIGSYSLQHVTRDTHGFAQKATYIEVLNVQGEAVGIEIFKDPITSPGGLKKSAKGLLQVVFDGSMESYIKEGRPEDGTRKPYKLVDQCTWEQESKGELQIIYEDGKFYNQTTLEQIRERVNTLI